MSPRRELPERGRTPASNKRTLKRSPKLPQDFFAYLRTYIGDFYAVEITDPQYHSRELVGPDLNIIMNLGGASRIPVSLRLSLLTSDEVEKMKEFFTFVFERLEIIVAARDEAAWEAHEGGDDTIVRIYRQDGILVEREGKSLEYYKSISKRSFGFPDSGWGLGSDEGGDGGTGSDLAEHEPGSSEPQDDGSETHVS